MLRRAGEGDGKHANRKERAKRKENHLERKKEKQELEKLKRKETEKRGGKKII